MKGRIVFWVVLAAVITAIELFGRLIIAYRVPIGLEQGTPPFAVGLVGSFIIGFSGVIAYWLLWLLPGRTRWAQDLAARIGKLRPPRPVPLGDLTKKAKKEAPERATRFVS